MCKHRNASAPFNKTHYTGQITLRLSDGMIMATTWTEQHKKCLDCGCVWVCEFGEYSHGSEPTGTTIDISKLPKL